MGRAMGFHYSWGNRICIWRIKSQIRVRCFYSSTFWPNGGRIFHLQHKGCVSSQRQSHFERATRSLATFVRSHRSLRSLAPQRFASLRTLCSLAMFTGSLTHFAHSLVGQLKFLNMCSHCYRVLLQQTRFWRSLETRPK